MKPLLIVIANLGFIITGVFVLGCLAEDISRVVVTGDLIPLDSRLVAGAMLECCFAAWLMHTAGDES